MPHHPCCCAGIANPCCPANSINETLYLTISTPATCYNGEVITLTYNPSLTRWEGSLLGECAGGSDPALKIDSVILVCQGSDASGFKLFVSSQTGSGGPGIVFPCILGEGFAEIPGLSPIGTPECEPFTLTFTFFITGLTGLPGYIPCPDAGQPWTGVITE